MTKRPLTPHYIFFYILFSQETWRILFAVIFSVLVAPHTYSPGTAIAGKILMYIMVAGIGFAAAGIPARFITHMFKKLVLGDKVP